MSVYVFPACIEYKVLLGDVIYKEKKLEIKGGVELDLYKRIHKHMENISRDKNLILEFLNTKHRKQSEKSLLIAKEILPISDRVTHECNEIENLLPDHLWRLPTYFDMLFIR